MTVIEQQEVTVIPEIIKLIGTKYHSYTHTSLLEYESRGTVISTVNANLFIVLQEE